MLTSMHHDINHYANLYASELTSMHYSSIGLGVNHRSVSSAVSSIDPRQVAKHSTGYALSQPLRS